MTGSWSGAFVVLMFAVGLAAPDSARALDWDSLWWNDNQRGAGHMQREEYTEAARTFDNERWRAAALYRAGQYRDAAEAWSALDDVHAHYNRGNALARAGDLPAAVEAYETVLERDPDHADARYNLELLREHMQGDQDTEDADKQQDESRDGDERDSDEQRDTGGEDGEQDQRSAGQQSDKERDGQPPDDAGADGDHQEAEQTDGTSDEPDEDRTDTADGDETDRDQAAGMSQQSESDDGDPSEQAAMEQWLRRIPDDPGGLLRRKFRYQYQRRERGEDEVREPW